MTKDELIEMINSAGLRIEYSRRLSDDRGEQFITSEGPILTFYHTGALVVGGKNVQRLRRDLVGKDVRFCQGIDNTRRFKLSVIVQGEEISVMLRNYSTA